MENISSLLGQSQAARKSNNWKNLEEISIRILQTLFKGNSLKDETLKQVIINYIIYQILYESIEWGLNFYLSLCQSTS